jgi:hypothetical protein
MEVGDSTFRRERQIESVRDLKDELTVIMLILWEEVAEVGIQNIDKVNISVDFESGINKTEILAKQQIGGEYDGSSTKGSGHGVN